MSSTFQSNNNQRKLLAGAGVVIVILLILLAILLYNKYGDQKEIETQEIELAQAEEVKAELQKEYDNAISELDEALAENNDIKGIIAQQKEDLSQQRKKIERIIREGKVNRSKLSEAREEIKNLIRRQTEFIAKIDQLERENRQLTEKTVVLTKEKTSLQEEVSVERQVNEGLQSEKTRLEQEKAELENTKVELEEKTATLETQKEELTQKVNIASVVQTQNIRATGYKIRNSGKRVKKNYAKNVDVLNICFKALDNGVAPAGTEAFYVRVVSPLGETLAIENLGSGVLINRQTNEQIRYTKVKEVDYANEAVDICLDWQPEQAFVKGQYLIEVYNKGSLAGTGDFTLK